MGRDILAELIEVPEKQGVDIVSDLQENKPQEAIQQVSQPEQSFGEYAKGTAQAALEGATAGFDDEIQSFIAAAVASPFISDKTFGQLMSDARQSFRDDKEKFAQENPKTALASNIAGGLATGGLGAAKTGTIKGGALVGGAFGGAAGAGLSDQDEFISAETAEDAAIGAGIGAVTGGAISGIINKWKAGPLLKRDIARRLGSGETDNDLAKYMIDGAGKLKTDKTAVKVIDQGFDEGVIAAVKGSSSTDRSKMLQMVNILERGRKNKLQSIHRPSDIAGDSLLSRFRHVRNVNKEAGKDIDRIASTLKGQSVDMSEPVNEFAQVLDDFGVELVKTEKGIRPNFENSILAPGDRGPIKEVIRQMARIAKSGNPDAFQAHQLKRIIDNNVTFGKTKTGMSGDAGAALKNLRRGIDTVLDETFDSYNQANTIYSETVGALNSLQDVAGRKMDLTGPNADKAVGTLLRRLMSNAQSRVNLQDSVNELDSIAKKYGGQFDDNINAQMLFVDELNRMFRPSATTSLAGEVGKEVERVANRSAGQTLVGETMKQVGKGVEHLRGINEENALRLIKELLRN